MSVPSSAVIGNNSIVATDGDGNSASTSFIVVLPTVSLNPGGGPVGTSVTISGSNFMPNSVITIKFRWQYNVNTLSTVSGAIPIGTTFPIPSLYLLGTYTLNATDSFGNSSVTNV